MNIALWIIAGVLAAAFAAAGTTKLIVPRERLAEKMAWTTDATDAQVKLIGGLEVAGAIGLILPAALGIAAILVPIAAVGLAATMIGAIGTHVKHRERLAAASPAIVLGLLCVVVAWGRFGPHAF